MIEQQQRLHHRLGAHAQKAWHGTVGVASTSRAARLIIGGVIVVSMMMVAATLAATFVFIDRDKINLATGTLLGGIFTFFGGFMGVSIRALLSALKNSRKQHELA